MIQKYNQFNESIQKSDFTSLILDGGYLISLNAAKIKEQVYDQYKSESDKMLSYFNSNVIDNMSYNTYVRSNDILKNSKILIGLIYNFLKYIKDRLKFFKNGSLFVQQYKKVEEKYLKIVN